ncbi:MAG: Type 1 glutamine amidotransferase-like domain-containing protein [Gemmatimonadota bacterium]|nr:Type 1 glutamine amidotransferase-like domain-containing protein [Gemmatimonadota bacterium]
MPRPLEPEPVDQCPEPGDGIDIGGIEGTGADTERSPIRRLVLMGGGGEDDPAARQFVEAARGGDIVILRATGSLTSYPQYFSVTLQPDPVPATVVTVRTTQPEAARDPAVLCRVDRAEALWLAGGNQWHYLGRWPDTLHTALAAATARGAAFGGTSAGAVSLGEAAFDAEFGTVTSPEALADPLRREVSITRPAFAQPELAATLVDSHFMERGREGRLLVFLARFLDARGAGPVVGVGLDEGVALVIEDETYVVSTEGTGGAWLYEVSGPAQLAAGVPLTLHGIRRVVLRNGATGNWPFDFENAMDARVLRVENGVVLVGEEG